MQFIRRLTQSSIGMIVTVTLSLVLVVIGMMTIVNFIRGDGPDMGRSLWYVDSENGKAFQHKLVEGEMDPILSPYSGKNTGYAGVSCRWTASGEPKDEPTWVILNEQLGKTGPTFCPDCGRLVVGHNPDPAPGKKAPPTRQEYAASHPGALTSVSSEGGR